MINYAPKFKMKIFTNVKFFQNLKKNVFIISLKYSELYILRLLIIMIDVK